MGKLPYATSEQQRVVRLVVVAAAAYRATWMILAEDGPGDILMTFRAMIYETFDESHWIHRGFNCPFCISFWMVLIFMICPKFIANWFAAAELARRIVEYDRRHA